MAQKHSLIISLITNWWLQKPYYQWLQS